MKIAIITTLAAASLSANAFVLNLTGVTGSLGTQTVAVAGYGNVTVSGLPAPGNIGTSPFGLILGAGDAISITFSGAPVTNVSAVTTIAATAGPTQTSANTYLLSNAAAPSGFSTAFVTSINFDEDPSVPEPSSLALLGLAGVGFLTRRRK